MSFLILTLQPLDYCSLNSVNCGAADEIRLVRFAGIDRTSTCDSSPRNYATPNPVLIRGTSEQLDIDCHPSFTFSVAAWIDFNGDGVFDHPSEMVLSGVCPAGAGNLLTGSVSIPEAAQTGQTVMRVYLGFGGNNPAATGPCVAFSNGEDENYYLTLSAGEKGGVFPQE